MDFNSSRKQQMTRNDSLFTSIDDASSCTSEVVATFTTACLIPHGVVSLVTAVSHILIDTIVAMNWII